MKFNISIVTYSSPNASASPLTHAFLFVSLFVALLSFSPFSYVSVFAWLKFSPVFLPLFISSSCCSGDAQHYHLQEIMLITLTIC